MLLCSRSDCDRLVCGQAGSCLPCSSSPHLLKMLGCGSQPRGAHAGQVSRTQPYAPSAQDHSAHLSLPQKTSGCVWHNSSGMRMRLRPHALSPTHPARKTTALDGLPNWVCGGQAQGCACRPGPLHSALRSQHAGPQHAVPSMQDPGTCGPTGSPSKTSGCVAMSQGVRVLATNAG